MIKRIMLRSFILVFTGVLYMNSEIFSQETEQGMSEHDKAYLHEIAQQTWSFLAWNVDSATGLPYDGYPRANKYTSVTNIGFFLASLGVAQHLGFLDEDAAYGMAKKALQSVAQLKTRAGFRQSWNHPGTLQPSSDDPWISVLDSGNFAAGLIILKELLPRVKGECDILLNEMKWEEMYDPDAGFLYGGMKRDSGEINKDWHLELLGTDARLAYVVSIGSGKVPKEAWGNLYRETEELYRQSYFTPGWQGGGIFMQYISGLFIDERMTILGEAAAQFAYAQLLHAQLLQAPVWGWSASVDPDGGYLGWGKITDEVVTPHASILALLYFPEEVLRNLHAFDDLGLRKPVQLENGELILMGYADAINWKTGTISDARLTLDQCMLFLSIANTIADGIVWKAFSQSAWISKALGFIPDFAEKDSLVTYAQKGYRGIHVEFDKECISSAIVNDGENLKKSQLIVSWYDRTNGNKSKEPLKQKKERVRLRSGETVFVKIPVPESLKLPDNRYYVEVIWQDKKQNRIDKKGMLVSY